MSTMPIAEIKALEAVLQKAASDFQRVGSLIYQGGRDAMPKFDGNFFETGFWGGLHSIPEVPNDGDPTPVLTGFEPVVLRYRRRTWRGAVKYLWAQKFGDKIGYYANLARSLGEALAYTKELLMHEPLNRATDTTYTGGWDNLPLLSNAHPLLAGTGTFNNLNTYVSPSQTVLESLQVAFNQVPDAYGRPIVVPKINLVVPSSQEYTWRQLLGTGTAISRVEGTTLTSPQPNPNIVSVVESGRFTLIPTPYIFYPNNQAYFAIGVGHELFFAEAFARSRNYAENNPEATVHEVQWSGNVGWRSAERIIGYTA